MPEVHALRVQTGLDTDEAMLLRLVSVLTSRRVRIESLAFATCDGARTSLSARVTLGNANAVTVQESLRRVVGVLSVDLVGVGELHAPAI